MCTKMNITGSSVICSVYPTFRCEFGFGGKCLRPLRYICLRKGIAAVSIIGDFQLNGFVFMGHCDRADTQTLPSPSFSTLADSLMCATSSSPFSHVSLPSSSMLTPPKPKLSVPSSPSYVNVKLRPFSLGVSTASTCLPLSHMLTFVPFFICHHPNPPSMFL